MPAGNPQLREMRRAFRDEIRSRGKCAERFGMKSAVAGNAPNALGRNPQLREMRR
jgi:hypothetical protein